MRRYKNHYFPLLPTILVDDDPENMLLSAPLKFWAIVCTGSRRISEPLGLYQRLQPSVLDFAMRDLNIPPSKSFQVIEGLILICNWHLVPGNFMSGSISFVLSGVAYHKAHQLGLDSANAHAREDEKISNQSVHNDRSRAETLLWTQTLLTYQT